MPNPQIAETLPLLRGDLPVDAGQISRPAIAVERVDGAREILALKPEWLALEERCPDTALFQSYAWCANHIDYASGKPGFRPFVLCLRRAGALVGLLPLCLRDVRGLTCVTGLCEPFQLYTELLLAPEFAPKDAAAVLGRSLRQVPADFVHLGQVRADGPLHACLKVLNSRMVDGDVAPYVDLGDWPDFDSFYRSRNAKTRKNMRNAANRLQRGGELAHRVAGSEAERSAIIERCHAGREAWLQRLGLISRAFRDDSFSEFLGRFSDRRQTGIETLAVTLSHAGKPIADQWGFVYRGRYYAFMATWDPDYEAFSPGRMHLGEVIRTCFAHGIRVADFMIPGVAYKFTWTDKAAQVNDHVLALRLRGYLHTHLWLSLLRPVAKRMMGAMPPALRKVLVQRVLPLFE